MLKGVGSRQEVFHVKIQKTSEASSNMHGGMIFMQIQRRPLRSASATVDVDNSL